MTFGTFLGNVTVDLSSASFRQDTTVTIWNFGGDVTVILPDGVRSTLEGFMGLGSRKIDLADPRHGAPLVTVRAYHGLGDTKLLSLSRVPEGRFRKLWRKLRE